MVREAKTSKSALNVKAEEWLRSWFSSGQVCTLRHHSDALIARVRAKSSKKPTGARLARVKKLKRSKRLCKFRSNKVSPTIMITSLQDKVTKQ